MASAIEEDQPVTGPHPIDTSIVDPLGFRRWMVPLRYQLPRFPFGLEDGVTRWLEFSHVLAHMLDLYHNGHLPIDQPLRKLMYVGVDGACQQDCYGPPLPSNRIRRRFYCKNVAGGLTLDAVFLDRFLGRFHESIQVSSI